MTGAVSSSQPSVSAASARLRLVVGSVSTLSARVKSFDLRDPQRGELPPFTAGAHVDLELPNGMVRSYSLVNAPSERRRYVVAVLREEAGKGGSAWIHENLWIGDSVHAGVPQNRFEIDEGGDHHLLLGAGIGITPLIAMAERLDELALDFRIVYCNRTADDAAFGAHLTKRFGDRVTLHCTEGRAERRLDLQKTLGDRPPGTHVYLCGPAAFIADGRAAAADWPTGTVHFELFGNATAAPGAADNLPFDVYLRRRNLRLRVPADGTILQVLTENGIAVKTVCQQGFCGSCTTRYLSGDVEHRDGVLDPVEQRSLVQVCVSRARGSEPLVLDL